MFEQSEAIRIYIPDITYDRSDDPEASDKFQRQIEEVFGQPFEYRNIGAGADFPSFLTWVPPVASFATALIAIFLSGERIEKNLDAWLRMKNRLQEFLRYRGYFDRQGASVIAVGEALENLADPPASVRLVGYALAPHGDMSGVIERCRSGEIAGELQEEWIGEVVHVFLLEIDGREYVVKVDSEGAHLER